MANNEKWVGISGLRNKSLHQSNNELKRFLVSKNLLDEDDLPTGLALKLGFAKWYGDWFKWNLDKYICMMQAHRKILKLKSQGKPIHPAAYNRALIHNF